MGDRIPVGGEIFRTHSDRPWCPTSRLYNGRGSFPGVKRPRRGVDHAPPSSDEIKAIPLLPLWVIMDCSRVNFYIVTLCPRGCFLLQTCFHFIQFPLNRGFTVYTVRSSGSLCRIKLSLRTGREIPMFRSMLQNLTSVHIMLTANSITAYSVTLPLTNVSTLWCAHSEKMLFQSKSGSTVCMYICENHSYR